MTQNNEDAPETTEEQPSRLPQPNIGRGRPTKLTPAVKETICNAIRIGMRYEEACRLAKITAVTFRRWRDIGANAKSGVLRDFYIATKEAEVEGENKLLSNCARSG